MVSRPLSISRQGKMKDCHTEEVPDNVALTAAVKGLEQPPVRKDGMLSEG